MSELALSWGRSCQTTARVGVIGWSRTREGPLEEAAGLLGKIVKVHPTIIVTWIVVALVAGCSSVRRISSDMTAMTENVGVMASQMPIMIDSMNRMASSVERLEGQVQGGLDAISSASPKIEPYLKAYDKSNKSLIEQVEGIRQELARMKMSVGTGHKGELKNP